VTTFKPEDLKTLKTLLDSLPEPITQAGLHPTAEQIELYAYHLPNSTLSNLMDIFVNLSTVDDSLYFMCNVEDFKFFSRHDSTRSATFTRSLRFLLCPD
jgi:ATP-dependent RNA helicase SUPV3L1/SUV3